MVNYLYQIKSEEDREVKGYMLLNLIIAGIVGLLFVLGYAMKNLFDVIKNMDRSINKLKRVTDLLDYRLSRLEIISLVDKEKVQKNTTKNE